MNQNYENSILEALKMEGVDAEPEEIIIPSFEDGHKSGCS